MTEPIRIFIGTEAKTRVPELVLMHSIKSRTKANVEFVTMGDYEPWLIPNDVHQATGFSLRRWLIPEYCNHEGHAIYLDADQIVLTDIQELWNYRNDGSDAAIWCCFRPDKCSNMLTGSPNTSLPQTSVMLINCLKCKSEQWQRDVIFERIRSRGKPHSGRLVVEAYQDVMHGMIALLDDIREINGHWNAFNECPKGTRLLHYTFETQQPWYQPWHELCGMWEAELKSAIEAGDVTRDDLEAALQWGRDGSQDWRKYGGLNEYWEKMLPLFSEAV